MMEDHMPKKVESFDNKVADAKIPTYGDKDVKRDSKAESRVLNDGIQFESQKPLSEHSVKVGAPKVSAEAEKKFQEAENYFWGTHGCQRDVQKAESLYLEAADAGHGRSAYLLGCEYKVGKSFTKDLSKSFYYIKIAATLEIPLAFELLAGYYKDGIGVAKDSSKAKDYYEKAIQAGVTVSQIVLVELDCDGLTDYQKGEKFEELALGKLKSAPYEAMSYLSRASDFYELARDQGVSGAREKRADMVFRIAELEEQGFGFWGEDLNKVLVYYQNALEQGSPLAIEKFKKFEALLEAQYTSGAGVQEQFDDQPLLRFLREKFSTFEDTVEHLYGANSGGFFESRANFLKAAGYYFIVGDQQKYHKMIDQLQLKKQELLQSKEPSIPKMPVGFDKLSDNIDQAFIHEHFWNYLDNLASKSPNNYSKAENYRIYKDMNEGQCNGYSLYYAMLALSGAKGQLQDKTEKYAEFMNQIVSNQKVFEPPEGFSYIKFEKGDPQGLTEDEIKRLQFTDQLKTFIQMIRYAEQNFAEIEEMTLGNKRGEGVQIAQTNIKMLMGEEFDCKVDLLTRGAKVKQGLYDLVPLMNVALTENNVGLLTYSTSSGAHIISITYREGKYFFFDSNHSGAEKNYDLRYSAVACETLDEIIGLIINNDMIEDQLSGLLGLQVVERNDVTE